MSVQFADQEFADVQRRQLNPLLTGLGALYVALLINHTVLQPDLRAAPLIFLGSATAMLFVGSRWLFTHRQLTPIWAESMSSALAGAVILHGLLHLYFLASFTETHGLVLLAMGILAYFLSLKRLTMVLIATLTTWVGVALIMGPSAWWLNFAFGLFIATGLKLYSTLSNTEVSEALLTASQMQQRCRQMEERLEAVQCRMLAALEASEAGFFQWEADTDRLEASPRFFELMGLHETITHAGGWLDRIRTGQRFRLERVKQTVTPTRPRFEEDFEVLHQDQEYRWMRVRGTALFDSQGALTSLTGWQSDVTQVKSLQYRLYQRSFRDELTGLSNRRLFVRQLREALQQTHESSPEYGVVVAILDIDRFRRQVDRFGYEVGDRLLKVVSQRLQSRTEATAVARLEADRFALLFSKQPNPLAAQGLAAALRQIMAEPFGDGARTLQLSVSLGLVWGQEGSRPEVLLGHAHHAMRLAKSSGPGRYAVYDPEKEARHNRLLELESRVEVALRNRELELVYQPVVAMKNGQVVGVAGELRWNHPSRGLLFPEQFMEAIVSSGLEAAVAWWQLREGCAKFQEWLSKNPANPLFSISLPMAARQFADLGAVDRVFDLIGETELSLEALRLEVTEAIIDSAPAAVLPMLSDLQDRGVQIHLAQFGSRLSSPAVLERFQFDALKLAPSFMEGIDQSTEKRQAVEALLRLAQEMAVDVIAAGLDSARQVEVLEQFNCDYGQGSFFWPAMDPEMMAVILDETVPDDRG